MKIGIIVDGQAEFRSLPELLKRIECKNNIVKLLYADIQPLAPIPQIVRAIQSKLLILKSKQVDKALILIDRENRDICPGNLAEQIKLSLERVCKTSGIELFAVVIKESCYENWLIADTGVFAKMPKRFALSQTNIKRIEPNKADRVDAQGILKRSAKAQDYEKIQDSIKIMRLADPLTIAYNSRSFRKFLRELGHELYKEQSLQPYPINANESK